LEKDKLGRETLNQPSKPAQSRALIDIVREAREVAELDRIVDEINTAQKWQLFRAALEPEFTITMNAPDPPIGTQSGNALYVFKLLNKKFPAGKAEL
jgi:hypothetical protein